MNRNEERKTGAQIQREMQERQFAVAQHLEMQRWHRDIARQVFLDHLRVATEEGGIIETSDDVMHKIAAASVRAADNLLSAILARPAESITPDQAVALCNAIAKKEIPLAEFLATFEIAEVEDLPASKFDDAMASIIL